MTPEDAYRRLRAAALTSFVMDGQLYSLEQVNEAARTLEDFVNALDPAERRRALARAASNASAPTDD